jgi:D-alanine transaminase
VPEIAYVNGKFLPLDRAVVHVEDRGFQFADAVYEVVRTYYGKPFAADDHLVRLFRSLDAIQLKHQFTTEQLKSVINEAVDRAGFPEAIVYLQITRGRARRHRGFPTPSKPTIVLTVRGLEPSSHLREKGVAVITVPDFRWARCDIKTVSLLANVLAYNTARQAGAHDALFVGADGIVSEATAGNIFVLSRAVLKTPPKGPQILLGVTRDKILHAARAAGVQTMEETITKPELSRADEIFLTSTTAEVVPVVSVDGQKVGSGKPGPVSARIYEQFTRIFVQQQR